MKQFYNFTIFILILEVIFFQTSELEAKKQQLYKRKLKLCKIDNFFNCLFEPLTYLSHQVNGTGIPNSEAEMEQFCL